jgi:hypothetical protein
MWWLKDESQHTFADSALIGLLETTAEAIARDP